MITMTELHYTVDESEESDILECKRRKVSRPRRVGKVKRTKHGQRKHIQEEDQEEDQEDLCLSEAVQNLDEVDCILRCCFGFTEFRPGQR